MYGATRYCYDVVVHACSVQWHTWDFHSGRLKKKKKCNRIRVPPFVSHDAYHQFYCIYLHIYILFSNRCALHIVLPVEHKIKISSHAAAAAAVCPVPRPYTCYVKIFSAFIASRNYTAMMPLQAYDNRMSEYYCVTPSIAVQCSHWYCTPNVVVL